MNADELRNERDRKHAERSENRHRAKTYTHHNRAQLRDDTGSSVECPRCAAQVLYGTHDVEIICENCGELIRL